MKEDDGKTFKAMNENGKCYSFKMRPDATLDDAKKYAKLWNSLAGSADRVAKVWETEND